MYLRLKLLVCEFIWICPPCRKMRFFKFLRSSPHATFLGLRSRNSERRWGPWRSKGSTSILNSLYPKLGEVKGVKIFSSPPPSSKKTTRNLPWFFVCRVKMVRAKNPESFEKKCRCNSRYFTPLFVEKCDFFNFYDCPHAPFLGLGLGSQNSERRWGSWSSKGTQIFIFLCPKLGEI